ncbi:MAG: glycosyltransferase [Brasilonema sp.]
MNDFDEEKKRSTVILHIAPITGTKITGLTHSIPSLVKALHEVGVTTGLLTTASSGPYTPAQPYPVVYIRDLPISAAIAAMPKPLNQPDIIVFHSTYIPVHAWLAYESYRSHIPYVICPRGGMTRGAQQVKQWKKVIGNLLFFNWMVRHAAALHYLTQQEAADAKAWNRPIFIVGNPVDLPPVKMLACPGKKEKLQFVFIGRLDINHKGLDFLLEACAIAQASLREARVQVHLYGPDVQGSRQAIEKIIESYQIQDFVYLQNPVLGSSKQAVLQQVDLFVHTSRFEGHPMAVLEAMAYGIPCLLTPGTNMADEVAEAEAGWKVELNAVAIADAMRNVLSARAELPARGYAARNLVESKYSREQIGMQLLKEYVNLLS